MASKMFPPKSETTKAKTQRRWLQSVIAASGQPLPAFPWMRAAKSATATHKPVEVITGSSHRPTTPLFRRNGPAGGIAAR
ncbi:hypothetical protein [Paracoccus sp. IB05]|uniref:hypothetical protein n=1 Tax=Paracoccus sp. IB05 TaxID=2779367 RepID=UPI0018E897F6|nr:hypothetical protein [Paracoccus sp. IB05]MBJ2151284.1 hypothetical protein [Paracoccus sp. IB05]